MDARLLADFNHAIAGMYSGTNHDEIQNADRWLQHFGTTPGAWDVVHAILGDTTMAVDSPHVQFAVKTLHDKICCDIIDLTPEQRLALRESISAFLIQWGLRPGVPRPIIRRLSLCAAALAVQTQWTEFFEYITSLSSRAPPGHELIGLRVVFELLSALPDQCGDMYLRVEDHQRDQFLEVLNGFIPDVLRFLSTAWTSQVAADPDCARALLGCLANWVRDCNIQAVSLSEHPLLLYSLAALNQQGQCETTREAAVDLLIEVLRKFDARDENLPLVQTVVPGVMALEERYGVAVNEEDEDTCRAIARIITEMAEAYTDLLLSEQDMNQNSMIRLVLMCCSSGDNEVVEVTLRFWYFFVLRWYELRRWDEATYAWHDLEDLKTALQLRYGEAVMALCRECIRLLSYPTDYDPTDKEEVDRFESWRRQVGDTIGDCCIFLGVDQVVAILWQEASEQGPVLAASGNWLRLEGALASMLAAADHRGPEGYDERVTIKDDIAVPFIGMMEALPQLLAGSWEDCYILRATLSELVGHLGSWLKTKPTELGQVFTFLYGNLACSRQEVNGAAARSMRRLCSQCRDQLGEPILSLYDQIMTFPTGHLKRKDELALLDGLAAVVNRLPPEVMSSAIDKMLAPIQATLTNVASELTAAQSNGQVPQVASAHRKSVILSVETFQELVRNFTASPISTDSPQSALRALHLVWQQHDVCLNAYANSEEMVEALCRSYKVVIRASKDHFASSLNDMISHLLSHFAKCRQPAFLYQGSVLITEFGDSKFQGQYEGVLFGMISGFSESVFGYLSNLDSFTQSPELVEEYFYLLSRFLEYCPQQLLSSPLIGGIIQCGVVGLQLEHRKAHAGIVSCFHHLLAAGVNATKSSAQSFTRGQAGSELFKESVLQVLHGHGSVLIGGLVACLTSSRPAYGDREKGTPASVLWQMVRLDRTGALLSSYLYPALTAVPCEVLSEERKNFCLQNLGVTIQTFDDVGFVDCLRDLHLECSRNQRRIQRNALKANSNA